MSVLESLSRDRLVYIVFVQPSGQRIWQCRVDRKEHPVTKQAIIFPVFEDNVHQARRFPLETALICLRRWREELNLLCRLSLEPYSELIDSEPDRNTEPVFKHVDCFIVTDEAAQTGFYIKAVHTPNGPAFCLKFDHPLLEAQSIITPLSDGPEGPIRKSREMHFLEIEAAKPSPFRVKREAAEREAQEQQEIQQVGVLRPGDRGR